MSSKNKSISLLLVSFAILGCAFAQKITIPLNINEKGGLQFTVKYGTKQCEVNVIPSINYCSNIITKPIEEVENCGAKFFSDNSFTQSQDYTASFQLGDTEATLVYSVPTDKKSYYYGAQTLCFGSENYGEQRNTLIQLFQDGKITEERFYFSLNSSKSQNGQIGEINIGSPNKSMIKNSDKIVELLRVQWQGPYAVACKNNLKIFGKQLESRSVVSITLDSPFHQFTIFAFERILQIFEEQGIKYTYLENENYEVFLPSIEKLQPISLSLTQKDNTEYPIVIKPSQYTKKLANGEYQLLISPRIYTGSISLGYTIFETYYVGFDLPLQTMFISEKAEQQVNNFRGSQHISE